MQSVCRHTVGMARFDGAVTLTGVTEGPSPAEVGERLRERRKELSISVRELARRVAVSPSLISQIENGKTSPSVGTLYAIVTEMDLSLDEVFSGTSDPSRRGPNGGRALPRPLATAGQRKEISLSARVRRRRETRSPHPDVAFLQA